MFHITFGKRVEKTQGVRLLDTRLDKIVYLTSNNLASNI